jgi:hypothetical protein
LIRNEPFWTALVHSNDPACPRRTGQALRYRKLVRFSTAARLIAAIWFFVMRFLLLGLSASIVAVAQNTTPTAPASAARPGGGLTILDFKPAMDDLMTMLVQPRHIKLYYAGQAENWTLAAFELNELRGALARIGRTIPTALTPRSPRFSPTR